MTKINLPDDIELLKDRCYSAISPIKRADQNTPTEKHFLFNAKRTQAGRSLPPYYLVYFLLVDLLKFKNLGQFEKVSWSIPIEFNGKAFVVEHRKLGVGVFAADLEKDEEDAKDIVKLIHKGVKAARVYFEWVASEAVANSKLNVTNNCPELYGRYKYLLTLYEKESKEAEERKYEVHRETTKTEYSEATTIHKPYYQLKQNSNWLAISAIEAFYSWTEHLFIHLAIVSRGLASGERVAELAGEEWQTKFKSCIDIKNPEAKKYFDELIFVRRQLRNFIAHGAFGKQGETFSFHSSVGAVPVRMPHEKGKNKFSLFSELSFNEDEVIKLLKEFTEWLWQADIAPAMQWAMESHLPTILTMSEDGTYSRAMSSVDKMEHLIERMNYMFDQAANMDW